MATMSARAFNQNTALAKRLANQEPLTITDRGKPSHVLLPYAEYQAIKRPSPSLSLALVADDDIDFEPERLVDLPREVDL
ncbi:MAG: type II toxin-antitoxin system Phd/YefM family antitoxin [Bifidobacteriaceae bacterium]|jgi:prevent-host-death family protein|nr:type II toxin-antitoxin system Phd/YefM family antitoxin [Bifidobacteriaceae bacterium]